MPANGSSVMPGCMRLASKQRIQLSAACRDADRPLAPLVVVRRALEATGHKLQSCGARQKVKSRLQCKAMLLTCGQGIICIWDEHLRLGSCGASLHCEVHAMTSAARSDPSICQTGLDMPSSRCKAVAIQRKLT